MEYRKLNIILIFFLALIFTLTNAYADEQIFSVTVPMDLPVNVNEAGVVTTANNATITNNSIAPVKISDVSVIPYNGWSIDDYNNEFRSKKVNTMEIGIILNGYVFSSNGELTNFSDTTINVGSSIPINYDVKIPAQTTNITNENVANIVFTVDWDGGPPLLHDVSFINGDKGTIIGGETTVTNILDGTTISFPNTSPNQGYEFEHWIDINTNEIKSEASPITNSMTLKPIFNLIIDPIQTINDTTINIETGTIIDYNGSGGNITIPASVSINGTDYPITTIGEGAFQGKGINRVTIPNGIEIIEKNAFRNNSIISLTIPNSVASIGQDAFRYNKIGYYFGIGGTVYIDNVNGGVEIGNNAFSNNTWFGGGTPSISYTGKVSQQANFLLMTRRRELTFEDISFCEMDKNGKPAFDSDGYILCDPEKLERLGLLERTKKLGLIRPKTILEEKTPIDNITSSAINLEDSEIEQIPEENMDVIPEKNNPNKDSSQEKNKGSNESLEESLDIPTNEGKEDGEAKTNEDSEEDIDTPTNEEPDAPVNEDTENSETTTNENVEEDIDTPTNEEPDALVNEGTEDSETTTSKDIEKDTDSLVNKDIEEDTDTPINKGTEETYTPINKNTKDVIPKEKPKSNILEELKEETE
jgi:hypothetical protein